MELSKTTVQYKLNSLKKNGIIYASDEAINREVTYFESESKEKGTSLNEYYYEMAFNLVFFSIHEGMQTAEQAITKGGEHHYQAYKQEYQKHCEYANKVEKCLKEYIELSMIYDHACASGDKSKEVFWLRILTNSTNIFKETQKAYQALTGFFHNILNHKAYELQSEKPIETNHQDSRNGYQVSR